MSSDDAVLVQPLDGLYVLAVEDVDDARELLVVLLEIHGAKVTAVASTRAALAVLEREQPDVLVSDINMPDETGYDLIRLVRELPSEKCGEIPAIALTALAEPEDRAAILAAGFQAHLPKPVEPDELVTVIKAVTGPASR
jgi:CheY-like chemotaxis protein